MENLNLDDSQLIKSAVDLLKRHVPRGRSFVASALKAADGKVFMGLHVKANVARISLCAEAVALSSAIMAEASEFDTIATVHLATGKGSLLGWELVSPCGMCRELLSDYAPGLKVLIPKEKGDPTRVSIESLLPIKFTRPS